jgi:uncharacterized protein YndB with AHSA1/START domain
MSTERKRTLDLSVEVPGTPEDIWKAIATGPGITSWFAACEVDGRVGGSVVTDFGALGKDSAQITDWEPPHRFRGEAPFAGGVLAHEWLVEARDGGTCIVRVVASGFGTGDDWDAVYDGLATGWPTFLENLRLHLTHFAGRRADMLHEVAFLPDGVEEDAWGSLCAALGVPATLGAGARLETTGAGVPALAATVESAAPNPYLLRIEAPSPGTGFVSAEACAGGVMLHVALYLYGDAALADAAARDWGAWLAARFPAPASTH